MAPPDGLPASSSAAPVAASAVPVAAAMPAAAVAAAMPAAAAAKTSRTAKRNAMKRTASKKRAAESSAASAETGAKKQKKKRPAVSIAASANSDVLPVLFEDDHLIALNKPPGLLCHPSPGHWESGTIVHELAGRQRTPGFSAIPQAMLEARLGTFVDTSPAAPSPSRSTQPPHTPSTKIGGLVCSSL